MASRRITCFAFFLFVGGLCRAGEPLSKAYPIDFFRDVPSRNLKGLATRADGRLVLGPVLTDLNGPALPQLLWCLEPLSENRWAIGSGPDGKIIEVSSDRNGANFTAKDLIQLSEPQVLSLKRLSDGSLLAGTSPNGVLCLIREGKVVAQTALPSDSIFDIALRGDQAFVAGGNPARIYQVDLRVFAASGVTKERDRQLKAKGISTFGEVRDRNVRRIAWLENRLIAGSSPKGNIYSFSANGGSPQLLQENRDAEVAALLPQPNGDLFAALVFTTTQGEARINRPTINKSDAIEGPSSNSTDRFSGRSTVVYFPKDGFPETIVARSGLAFYALARRNDTLLIAGGEQGDIVGFDLVARQSLSFAGSDSVQVTALLPFVERSAGAAHADKFLVLRNNEPGLSLLDFASAGPRSAETRRLDLGIASTVGALRLARLREISADQLHIEMKSNFGSDEIEGWSPWLPTEFRGDGWFAPAVHGRNIKFRIQLTPTGSSSPELDDPTVYYLPQNRRPQLSEFRVAPPNFALTPIPESPPPAATTLGQLLGATEPDKRKNPLLNNAILPELGNQIVMWTVADPDGDDVTFDFAVRRESGGQWIDLVVGSKDSYAQFNTSHFEDGAYLTRLIAREQAPRPAADRLSVTFDTEEIVVDHTPPVIGDVALSRDENGLKISVSGHDALSLLEGAEFVFNNGYREIVTQPADGIRDSQTETFVLQTAIAKVAAATSVEVLLYDAMGNSSARRLELVK